MISLLAEGDKYTLVIGITLADIDMLKTQGFLEHEEGQMDEMPVRFCILFGETTPDIMEKLNSASGREIERPVRGALPTRIEGAR